MPLIDVDWANNADQPLSLLVAWSASVADALNQQLLPAEQRFRAETACFTRAKIARDVMSFSGPPAIPTQEGQNAGKSPDAFEQPLPTFIAPARLSDRLGVNVIDQKEGPPVAASVLFVGPDHKADSDGALAFAVQAAELLSAGAGVVIVDVLPGPAGWATHLQSLTAVYPAKLRVRGENATVLVVHPEVIENVEQFTVWHHALSSGFPLPTVPVPVRGWRYAPLDLEVTYTDACRRSRLA